MKLEISDFTGSKIALICGDKVLTILREQDDIPCPNMWNCQVVVVKGTALSSA